MPEDKENYIMEVDTANFNTTFSPIKMTLTPSPSANNAIAILSNTPQSDERDNALKCYEKIGNMSERQLKPEFVTMADTVEPAADYFGLPKSNVRQIMKFRIDEIITDRANFINIIGISVSAVFSLLALIISVIAIKVASN